VWPLSVTPGPPWARGAALARGPRLALPAAPDRRGKCPSLGPRVPIQSPEPVGHPAPQRGRTVQFNQVYPAGQALLSVRSPAYGWLAPNTTLFVRLHAGIAGSTCGWLFSGLDLFILFRSGEEVVSI
jgi:hypothetical protein